MDASSLERTLFDGATVDGVFYLTNRFNLLEFLSSGAIIPARGIEKYYRDLADLADGRLPLLRPPFDADVLAAVASEADAGSFPVAIEIDPAALGAPTVEALMPDGFGGSCPVGAPSAVAWAPQGVIPLSAAKAVHFRSERELGEHRARLYENIPDDVLRLAASPKLFVATDRPSRIKAWLGQLTVDQTPDRDCFAATDKLLGGIALLAQTTPANSDAFASLASALNARVQSLSSKLSEKKRPKTGAKRKANRSVERRDSGFPLYLERFVAGESPEKPISDPDEAFFLAAATALVHANTRDRWRPLDILAEIERLVVAGGMTDAGVAEIRRNLEPIRGILRNEREFKPLTSGKGLVSAKALLLVLMQSRPEKLASWDREESGADDEVSVIAATLSGLLVGHKRLPLSLRMRGLDVALANIGARMLSPSQVVRATTPATGEFSVESSPALGDSTLALLWLGGTVLSKPKAKTPLSALLRSIDYASAVNREMGMKVVHLLGWDDCIICTVNFPNDDLRLSRAKRGFTVTSSGTPVVAEDLNVDAFLGRLSVPIPADRTQEARSLVEAVGTKT